MKSTFLRPLDPFLSLNHPSRGLCGGLGGFALQTEADRSRFDSPVQPVACTSYEEEGKKPNPPAACGRSGIPAVFLLTLPTRQDAWRSRYGADHTLRAPSTLGSHGTEHSVGVGYTWVW